MGLIIIKDRRRADYFKSHKTLHLIFGGGGVVVSVSDLGSKVLGFDPQLVPKKVNACL